MSTATKPKPKAKRKAKSPVHPKAITAGVIHKALGHEIRRRILAELAKARWQPAGERSGMSPKELSKVLPWSLSTVSYHVTILRDCGAIKLQSTEQRRGATEHYYRVSDWMRQRQDDSKALDEMAAYIKGGYNHSDDDEALAAISNMIRETGREV